MAASVPDSRGSGFSTARVFSRAFGTIGANPLAALAIGLLFGVLLSEAYSYFSRSLLVSDLRHPFSAVSLGRRLAGEVVSWICAFLVQGAFVGLASAYEAGRRPSFAEAARAGAHMVFPLIALGLIVGLATTIGLVALIVPALFLGVLWSVSAPVLVEERCGVIAALGRSSALTQGARWQIFGIAVLVGVLEFIAGFAHGWVDARIFSGVGAHAFAPVVDRVVWAVFGTIFKTCSAAIFTSIYVELRNWKQGTPEAVLAEIFA